MIGHGKTALTPGLLAGFAAFLDISIRDLTADWDRPARQHR
jgi:hypothetical protein